MHTRLYSLRSVDERTILSIDLTGLIVTENNQTLEIKLPQQDKPIFLNKYEYVNKMKIYEDGKICFVACTKRVCQKYIKQFLLNYHIQKAEETLNKFQSFKERLEKELIAA